MHFAEAYIGPCRTSMMEFFGFVLSYKNLRDIKDTLVLVFSCVFCEIFKSKLSREHLPGDCFCKLEKVCFRNQVFIFA